VDDEEFWSWNAEMSERVREAKTEFERVSQSITATLEHIWATLDRVEEKLPPTPPEFVLVRGGKPDD
jgi:hypothetical protein